MFHLRNTKCSPPHAKRSTTLKTARRPQITARYAALMALAITVIAALGTAASHAHAVTGSSTNIASAFSGNSQCEPRHGTFSAATALDTRTVIGINVNRNGPPPSNPASRLADFGRIPFARGPYYDRNALPRAFDCAEANLIAPEHRLQMSFKRLPARILDGSYDRRISSYLNSVPAGWVVGITYWHEPNGEIAKGTFSAADFRQAWYRIGRLIKQSTSAATLIAMPNYTGPTGARYEDRWVVRRASMPANSILTWDKYGNPPPPIAITANPSLPYRGLYRRPQDVFGATLSATKRLGWGDHWAISEFNAPRRVQDPQEIDRRQWFVDAIRYLTSRRGVSTPAHLLIWEARGTQFDQRFSTKQLRDTLRPYFAGSP